MINSVKIQLSIAIAEVEKGRELRLRGSMYEYEFFSPGICLGGLLRYPDKWTSTLTKNFWSDKTSLRTIVADLIINLLGSIF